MKPGIVPEVESDQLDLGPGDFQCTACRERKSLVPFEKRTDLDGLIYDLWLCRNCYVILNATHLRESQNSDFLAIQADTSHEFYAVDENFLLGIKTEIEADGFIGFLLAQYPECARGVLLDFGAGRGITAAAAAHHFEKVYAAELSLPTLTKVHSVMPLKHKVFPVGDYLSIDEKFDAVVSLHTLEHLPNLREVLDNIVERMNPGAALLFQVPLLRKDYLVCVHYTFFTEASCLALARDTGLECLGVWYDNNLDFLTCIMKKSDRA